MRCARQQFRNLLGARLASQRHWPATAMQSALARPELRRGDAAASSSPQSLARGRQSQSIQFLQSWRHPSWGCLHSFSPKIPALMRFRCGLLAAFLFALSLASARPAAAQLTEEQSPGLRVIYFDGTEGYLVPHATRTSPQLARLSEKTLRLRSERRRDGAVAGPERLGQRRRLVGARTTWSASRLRRWAFRSRRSPPTSA